MLITSTASSVTAQISAPEEQPELLTLKNLFFSVLDINLLRDAVAWDVFVLSVAAAPCEIESTV